MTWRTLALHVMGDNKYALQECLPLCTIIFRIQGEDVSDLCYAYTDMDLLGCKLLQLAMLELQMVLAKV